MQGPTTPQPSSGRQRRRSRLACRLSPRANGDPSLQGLVSRRPGPNPRPGAGTPPPRWGNVSIAHFVFPTWSAGPLPGLATSCLDGTTRFRRGDLLATGRLVQGHTTPRPSGGRQRSGSRLARRLSPRANGDPSLRCLVSQNPGPNPWPGAGTPPLRSGTSASTGAPPRSGASGHSLCGGTCTPPLRSCDIRLEHNGNPTGSAGPPPNLERAPRRSGRQRRLARTAVPLGSAGARPRLERAPRRTVGSVGASCTHPASPQRCLCPAAATRLSATHASSRAPPQSSAGTMALWARLAPLISRLEPHRVTLFRLTEHCSRWSPNLARFRVQDSAPTTEC